MVGVTPRLSGKNDRAAVRVDYANSVNVIGKDICLNGYPGPSVPSFSKMVSYINLYCTQSMTSYNSSRLSVWLLMVSNLRLHNTAVQCVPNTLFLTLKQVLGRIKSFECV